MFLLKALFIRIDCPGAWSASDVDLLALWLAEEIAAARRGAAHLAEHRLPSRGICSALFHCVVGVGDAECVDMAKLLARRVTLPAVVAPSSVASVRGATALAVVPVVPAAPNDPVVLASMAPSSNVPPLADSALSAAAARYGATDAPAAAMALLAPPTWAVGQPDRGEKETGRLGKKEREAEETTEDDTRGE